MSRRRVAQKRVIQPDPKFNNVLLSKFINSLMLDGKKVVAANIVYQAFDLIVNRKKCNPVDLFEKVIADISPVVEVRPRRVGGATYQIPVEVRADRARALAFRWLVECMRKRSEKTSYMRLAGELLDASEGKGATIKKREDTYKNGRS